MDEQSADQGELSASADEVQAVGEVREAIRRNFFRTYPPGTLPARRTPHAKGHGCLRAEFVVCPDIPAALRIGVFRRPRTYEAVVRFSNGSPVVRHDFLPDVRGMAIKLLDLECDDASMSQRGGLPSQDFVLINYPAFFVRNATDFAEFASRIDGPSPPLSFFFRGLPWQWRRRELFTLLRSGLQYTSSPLAARYWSQTPYLLGDRITKYAVSPERYVSAWPRPWRRDYLRETMTRQLRKPATFAFSLQMYGDSAQTPADDATVIWPESVAPLVRVASLHIPAQGVIAELQEQLEGALSFRPWNCLPVHKPVGSLNLARNDIYSDIAKLRQERGTSRDALL